MLALALAAGIAFGDFSGLSSDAPLCAGATLLVVACLAPGRSSLLAAAAVGIAFSAGCLSQQANLELAARHAPTQVTDATVEARVCELARGRTGVSLLLCDVVSPLGRSLPNRVRLHERDATPSKQVLESLALGDRVRARLRLRPLREAGNPGQRSRFRAERRRGVGASASLVSPQWLTKLSSPLAKPSRASDDRVALLRARIARRLASVGPGSALLRALAIGDRGGLLASTREEWARLGISHLLAVSGLHLALVAGLAYTLLRSMLTRVTPLAMRFDVRTLALLGACVLSAGFALLAGWGIPVRRALVFLAATVGARLLGRGTHPAQLLSAAVLAIGVIEPSALFEAGAQLSFLASAGLLYSLGPGATGPGRADSAGGKLVRSSSMIVRTSATVTALTAPVLALHEIPVSSVALLANIFAVPATTGLLLPLSLLAGAAASFEPTPMLNAILALAESVARGALGLASNAASLLGQSLQRPAPPLAWVGFASLIGLSSLRSLSTLSRVASAWIVVAILQLAPIAALPPRAPRVVSLDVGLGDATLVQGRDAALLVDAGVAVPPSLDLGRSVVLPALRALGVDRIDVVVASHGDADHRGGLPAVLAALPVGELWLPPGGISDPSFAALLSVAERVDTQVRERAREDGVVQVGDLRVTLLWPPRTAGAWSRNDRSLVLQVELAGRRVLLTGDIGAQVESQLIASGEDLRADLLKVAHHGSRGSSSVAFLRAVGAQVALVSAPCSTRAALPTSDALARLRAVSAAPWWTGRHGALFVSLPEDGSALTAWGWLEHSRLGCVGRTPRP